MNQVFHKLGLHPITAVAMILVDFMLFGSDATGVGWIFSCIVAFLLVLPCIFIQKLAYKDGWLMAIAKGLIVGVITAIPTSLPAVFTGIGGVMGALSAPKQNVIEQKKE